MGNMKKNAYQNALLDLTKGLLQWRIWFLLSWQDIRLRYRRSQIGPFWITISMGITIYTMGLLYSHLFAMKLDHYYPLLAAGMIPWALISSMMNESTQIFIEAENYLKQIKLPYTIFVVRVICRNFIIFFHNILIIIPIIIIFHVPINWHTLLIIPGLILIALVAFVYGKLLAMLGARLRDFGQVIGSLTQVIFFLTPVMWDPNILQPKYQWMVKFNPFAQFIELIRAPLLGNAPSLYAVNSTLILLAVGILITYTAFVKYRARIIYWL